MEQNIQKTVCVDGRLIFKMTLKKWVMRVWTGLNWLIVVVFGPVAIFNEDISQLSGFMKTVNLLTSRITAICSRRQSCNGPTGFLTKKLCVLKL